MSSGSKKQAQPAIAATSITIAGDAPAPMASAISGAPMITTSEGATGIMISKAKNRAAAKAISTGVGTLSTGSTATMKSLTPLVTMRLPNDMTVAIRKTESQPMLLTKVSNFKVFN